MKRVNFALAILGIALVVLTGPATGQETVFPKLNSATSGATGYFERPTRANTALPSKRYQSAIDLDPVISSLEPLDPSLIEPNRPDQIGVTRSVNISPQTAGRSIRTSDGSEIVFLSVRSPGAVAIRLHFEHFDIGADDEIYVYGMSDNSSVSGPYTGKGLYGDEEFWSGITQGDVAIVEWHRKALSGSFLVSGVGHIYAPPDQSPGSPEVLSCEVDASCSANNEKYAIARIVYTNDDDGKLKVCTGTLMNDRYEDLRSFFLTANHCISSQSEARSILAYWYYQTTGCNTGILRNDWVTSQGANLYASDATNDYAFLEGPPAPPGAVFSGWDSAPQGINTNVYGFHHPGGSTPETIDNTDSYLRRADGTVVGTNSSCSDSGLLSGYWVDWTTGSTEHGSSGSGLWHLSSDGFSRLVGVLSCGPLYDNDCSDRFGLYGKFSSFYPQIKVFLYPQNTLTVASSNPGSGVAITVSPIDDDKANNGLTQFTRRYAPNVSVTLTAPTSVPSGTFSKWQRDGVDFTTNSTAVVQMNNPHTMTAVYGTSYTITTSSSPSNGGTTTGGGTYSAGSSRTVTATPNSGYNFVSWTENGSTVSTSSSYTFTLNSNRTLLANFATVPYTITTSSSPSTGGTTTGGGTYSAGSSRTVTATANSGYSFVSWTENGSTVSTSSSYTFTLNSNRSLVANFSVTYTITTSSSPSAGGTTSGSGTFVSGSSRTVTATPNSGYAFVSWTQSGSVVSTSASYTFTLNSNRTLVATFETISTPSAPSGSISGSTGLSYSYSTSGASSNLGDSVQYQFDWGDGSVSGWLGVGTTGASHVWVVAGTYSVKAQARCATHTSTVSLFSTAISVKINFVPSGVSVADGAVIGLVANADGMYVTAEDMGKSPLIANRPGLGAWEQFQIFDLGDGTIALKSLINGKIVSAADGGNSPLIANRDSVGAWEQFRLQDAGNGNFVIVARANGKYVCAEDNGRSSLIANRTSAGGWEQFRMVFRPSMKPFNVTASFQAGGGGYISAGAGGNARLLPNQTSEGASEQFQITDVGNGNVAIRSLLSGRYVTADNFGKDPLVANRDAIGTWEQFQLFDAGAGMIALRAVVNGLYVSVNNTGEFLIANRTYVGPLERFFLNISLRAVVNTAFVCADNYGNDPLIANRPSIGVWEQFQVVNAGDGNFGLKAKVNGLFVCAENFGNEPLIANRPSVGLWETFQWIVGGNGNVALKAAVNGMFVCAEDQGRKPLIANRQTASVWEQFH